MASYKNLSYLILGLYFHIREGFSRNIEYMYKYLMYTLSKIMRLWLFSFGILAWDTMWITYYCTSCQLAIITIIIGTKHKTEEGKGSQSPRTFYLCNKKKKFWVGGDGYTPLRLYICMYKQKCKETSYSERKCCVVTKIGDISTKWLHSIIIEQLFPRYDLKHCGCTVLKRGRGTETYPNVEYIFDKIYFFGLYQNSKFGYKHIVK